jgi:hypothetical protein
MALGTLLYVGYVFLIYHAAASSVASSKDFNLPALTPKVFLFKNSLPTISLYHFATSSVVLNKGFSCAVT